MTTAVTTAVQAQVVPTPYSLKLLARRSREVQEKGGWVEYFDPDTSAFWYLEKVRPSLVGTEEIGGIFNPIEPWSF